VTILSMAFRNGNGQSFCQTRWLSAFGTNVPDWFLIFFLQLFLGRYSISTTQIADDLKKYNGYIPGYRPGKPMRIFGIYVDPTNGCRAPYS